MSRAKKRKNTAPCSSLLKRYGLLRRHVLVAAYAGAMMLLTLGIAAMLAPGKEGKGPIESGVCRSKPLPCPDDCSGNGRCVGGVCVCAEGWMGKDCREEICPVNCSGRGYCRAGLCVCEDIYGGYDCSLPKLDVFRSSLLRGVNLPDIDEGTNVTGDVQCQFVNKIDHARGIYKGGKKKSSLSLGKGVLGALPHECPRYNYSSCAIVGNSGTILQDKFGEEIDSMQMVYRFNAGPTEGFEEHVGHRTTFESLNAKFAHDLQNKKLMERFDNPIYMIFELRLIDVIAKAKRNKKVVHMLAPAFIERVFDTYNAMLTNLEKHGIGCFHGEKPMSGVYAILTALSMCSDVYLYGFNPWHENDKNSKMTYRYHYFNNQEPRAGAHNFDATYYMYLLMETTGRLHVRGKRDSVGGIEKDFESRDKELEDDKKTLQRINRLIQN